MVAANAGLGFVVSWRRDVATTVVPKRKDRRFAEADGAVDVGVDGTGSDQAAAATTNESSNKILRGVIMD